MAYLQQQPRFQFEPWPDLKLAGETVPMSRLAVAYGTVLQTLRPSSPSTSLLPREWQVVKRRQKQLMTANWIGLGLVVMLLILLGIGITHKLILSSQKKALLADAQIAVIQAKATERFLEQREQEFSKIRPLVDRQLKNMELLQTLQILQKVREQRDLWFVLLADQGSYFAGTTSPVPSTNQQHGAGESGVSTNRAASSRSYIVALSLPAAGGDKMKVMREVVDDLKKEKLFHQVDSLAFSQLNTNLLDAKALAPERSFTLSLELAGREEPKAGTPLNPQSTVPHTLTADHR
jgi:hypothetical protein